MQKNVSSTESQERFDQIARQLFSSHGAEKGKMFGMPCIKIRSKAFAGLFQDNMVFKLTGAEHTRALGLAGARLFDPSGQGRAMKEWVQVPEAYAAEWPELAEKALQYVASQIDGVAS